MAPARADNRRVADPDWPAYYQVTVDRPPWQTVVLAADRFESEGEQAQRFAVDLGCGAGRDTRELLRRGWRVLAIDREAAGIDAVRAATPPEDRGRLETRVEDLATAAIPGCDLVNASLSLPFLAPDAFDAAWARVVAAIRPGGRFAGMLFGDGDESATDPTMTCRSSSAIRDGLADFEIEFWAEKEEDGTTALGEPHHFHLIEVVARRAG